MSYAPKADDTLGLASSDTCRLLDAGIGGGGGPQGSGGGWRGPAEAVSVDMKAVGSEVSL